MQDEQSGDYKVSIDTTFKLKQVEVDGQVINIQLWDVPGSSHVKCTFKSAE